MVQGPFEECDDGVNDGGYRECGPMCHYEARCGDGVVQAGLEECDDGLENGSSACRADCTIVPVR
jgi:cysteine-rich repeat protein